MDSEGLVTFLCVYHAGSVSAAAGQLARTQSAISRRLAVLEAQIGSPLFDRVGRRMVMSDAGRHLLPHAERVTAALQDARAAARKVRSSGPDELRIAVVGTLADERLSVALRKLAKGFPRLDLRLSTATSAEVSEQVRSGKVSLGLRYFTDRSSGLSMKVVAKERLVVACAPTHRLAGRRVAQLGELADERWLAFPSKEQRGEVLARTILGQFLARGIDTLDWLAVDSLTAQKRLVEAGLGLALLQESAIQEELRQARLAVVRVADLRVEVEIVSVTRPDAYPNAAADAFVSALRATTRQRSASRRFALPQPS